MIEIMGVPFEALDVVIVLPALFLLFVLLGYRFADFVLAVVRAAPEVELTLLPENDDYQRANAVDEEIAA